MLIVCRLIPNSLHIVINSPMNSFPLSQRISYGTPKRATIFNLIAATTSAEVLLFIGISSTHFEKTSTQIRRCLKPSFVRGSIGM